MDIKSQEVLMVLKKVKKCQCVNILSEKLYTEQESGYQTVNHRE